jgi:hypothetical protein
MHAFMALWADRVADQLQTRHAEQLQEGVMAEP